MEYTKNDINTFVRAVKEASPLKPHDYDLTRYCELLINLAGMAHRMAEVECSCYIDRVESSDDPETVTISAILQERIQKLCVDYIGLTPQFQGDPRGVMVKLKVPDGLGDSWEGRDLLCVPQPTENIYL